MLKGRGLTKKYRSFAKIQKFNLKVKRFCQHVKVNQEKMEILFRGRGFVKR